MSEMPKIRFVEVHGTMMHDGTTRDQHWIVKGIRFDHRPSDAEVEAVYADASPRPDADTRREELEAMKALIAKIDVNDYVGCLRLISDLEQAIDAILDRIGGG